ncbi:MAG: AAA family ATPase [Candidatus Rokubacteria bacterium]|nr:AAA family ATPase [Candidatus Rokubacteria bacterium]
MPGAVPCPACRFENSAAAKFCGACGARLGAVCAACGTENPPTFKFCSECGSPLGAARPAAPPAAAPAHEAAVSPKDAIFRVQEAKLPSYTPAHLAEKILTSRAALEGERKAVTVLFADVAGFTELAGRLHPEDLHAVMDGCFERLSGAVHRYEGTINQFTGDGIMALFGAPIAREDHAERAIHAALAIQTAIAEYGEALAREKGIPFRMRIGLHSGSVVVGRIGDNLRMDYTAQGDTVNLAARLEQACPPGEVLVSEATRRLAEGAFAFRAVPPLSVKGKAAPVTAFEVVGRRARRARVELAAERGLTPLVGRERELEHLRQAFEGAREGRGQVVGIVGEAGVGKSRLLFEFRREQEGRAIYLEGRCISFGQTIPFLPLVEMLKRGLRIDEGDRDDTIREKVLRGLQLAGAEERWTPFLLNLLGVETDDPAVKGITAEARRRYTFEALRNLTLAQSARRPIVFAIEDLHWVDQPSQDFFRYLAEQSARAAVLVVVTYRPGYAHPWGDKSYYSQIALAPLSDQESERVVESVLGVRALPLEVKNLICQKAEGNPFYLEELTRAFVDAGILARTNGGYTLARGVTPQDVPDTVQGVIMARIDRLAETHKRTIQTAAVVGREFTLRLLRQITDIQERLEESLADLRALEFIYEKSLYPDLEYVFKHALVQDVAYGSLLKPRRRTLHELVGRAIEELYADRLDEHVAELAHHFAQGEVWPKAFEYARRAGDRARGIFANREAIHHYTQALEAAPKMTTPPGDADLLAIYEARGMVWLLLTNYDAAVADFEAMQAAARRLGERVKEGEALCNQAAAHWWRFSHAHEGLVEKCAHEAMAIAEDTGDERILARALSSLGMVDQKGGLLRAADTKFLRSVEICRRRGLKGPLVTNLVWLGAHANWRGEFRQAIEHAGEAERLAQETHEGFFELVAHCFRCNALAALGEWDLALQAIEEAMQKGRERENRYAIARGLNTLGWIHRELGDLARASELNREGIEIARAAKISNAEINATLNLAEDCLARGEVGPAQQILTETAERIGTGFFDSHLWRWNIRVPLASARLALIERTPDRAIRHLDEALRLAEKTESQKYLAEARGLRGELLAATGKQPEAAVELRAALGIAEAIAYRRGIWQLGSTLGRILLQAGRESEARTAYATALRALHAALPRIPTPRLKETLLASEAVARLREEAAALGVTA